MIAKTNLFSDSQSDAIASEDDDLTRDPQLPEFKPPLAALLSKYSHLDHIIFNPKYPPSNDAAFGAIFSEKNIFEQTVSAILNKQITLSSEPIAQAFNNAKNAAMNSVRFDILGKGTDEVDYSIDMQRAYNKERLHARTVYYACRLLATQKVAESRYECLPGVCITFIYENGKTPSSFINRVSLYNQDFDKYSDIFEIVEIYLKADLSPTDSVYLHILKDFLAIHSQDDANMFSNKYAMNLYASTLIKAYNAVTSNDYTQALDKTNLDGGYLMIKLTEEERIKLRAEGIEEGIEKGIEKGIKTLIETLQELNTPTTIIISKLMSKYNLTESEAKSYLAKSSNHKS